MDYLKTFGFSRVNIRCAVVIWLTVFHIALGDLEVNTTDGVLKGQVLRSRDGRPYYSYTGIPYAKPPVGNLRFQAPEPSEPWTGTLDATGEPNKCVQIDDVDSQEDCLYLNVFTPKVPGVSELLPVMFWIHGGGFVTGHGGPDDNSPEYFMDKDVVFVSINYRLGVLGFLSTGDDVIPGNFGMKDQVMALRWVQKNIIYFNGDSSRVTISGMSAGSVSVGYHLLSPMSKGLFHKAILQSGAPTCMWSISTPKWARNRAHTFATIAGCNYDTSEDLLKCLKKIPATFLINIQNRLHVWLNFPIVQFNIVVESCDTGKNNAFICHHPIDNFKQVSFVPTIVGLNSAEGLLFVKPLYNCTAMLYPEFRTDFNRLLPFILQYDQYIKPEDTDEIGGRIFQQYFPSGILGDESFVNASDMFGDGCLVHCILDMAKNLSSPVYTYLYDHRNEFPDGKRSGLCEMNVGVKHGDELISLLKGSSRPSPSNARDLEVSKVMVNIWYKFVASETLTINGTDAGAVWPEFSANDKFPFLYIDSAQPTIIPNPFEEKYQFWSQLFRRLRRSNEIASRKSPDVKTKL